MRGTDSYVEMLNYLSKYDKEDKLHSDMHIFNQNYNYS